MDTCAQRIALNPWTHFRRLLKSCLLKINSLRYWFELKSDWQLGEKVPILIQFSTYPEKKIKCFILKLQFFIFKKYTKYKMQAICQGTYIYELCTFELASLLIVLCNVRYKDVHIEQHA